MTDKEKQIAIATTCGWTVSEHGWWSHPTLPCNGGAEPEPPDYLNDLNAIHEAEKMLTTQQRIEHGKQLQEITSECVVGYVGDYHRELVGLSRVAGATAAQRAEAFLKTLNLWIP
jgi:hypothetical protein